MTLQEAMRRALALAARARPHPNPRVGAVLLDDTGQPVAEGFHLGPGHDHAERAALSALAPPFPDGLTMVVTLEPCDHHGRTPPCTEAIIEAGVRRVVVGATDPDTRAQGKGVERLRAAGIDVEVGVLANEVEAADPAYFHHRRTGRARFTLKTAATLDGQTAAADGTSQWITSEEARRDVHLLRAASDAVMVGAGTLRADDPALTVRLEGWTGRQPVGVVVAGAKPLPENRALWQRTDTVVITDRHLDVSAKSLVVPAGRDGLPDLERAAVALADSGHLAVLVEGGSRLAAALWRQRLIDAGVAYLGGRIAGGTGKPMLAGEWATFDESVRVEIGDVRRLGPDVRVEWLPVWESNATH